MALYILVPALCFVAMLLILAVALCRAAAEGDEMVAEWEATLDLEVPA